MEFEKVSFEQYKADCKKLGFALMLKQQQLRKQWEEIKLPTRATSGSAGYDFYLPTEEVMVGFTGVTIPTGIRVKIDQKYFLMLAPRSGLGFKYGMRLANTVGIIDADYYNADNEGHIMAKINSEGPFTIKTGDRFMQGIFMPYGIVNEDNTTAARTGGFGSTDA